MVDVKVKKWGNSMGIIIPKELVKERNIEEGETISILVSKKADFSKTFGKLKSNISGQEFKDLVRKGWD